MDLLSWLSNRHIATLRISIRTSTRLTRQSTSDTLYTQVFTVDSTRSLARCEVESHLMSKDWDSQV